MADLGLYALRLALLLCGLGIAAGVYAGITRRDDWTRVAERSVLLVCAAVSAAIGALFYALATNDFSIAYVAQHSARTMPLHYRLGALWGGQALVGTGFYNVSGLAWSGRGKIRRVDVSADGGRNWRTARLEQPVLPKCLTRFNVDWTWDGKPATLQSRAIDDTGYVQPQMRQLRAVRGTRSIYHNNAIQSWHVAASGEVGNVHVG